MDFKELKFLLKKLFSNYVKKHIKRILIALILSILVAGSTSGIAWLLDPAVKKIFIDQDKIFAWTIPVLIVCVFLQRFFSYLRELILFELERKLQENFKKK